MSDDEGWDEYREIIRGSISNDPRSLQVTIGPSEVGIPCDRCLARKLAGIPEQRGEDWLPAVGKAVHNDIAAAFRKVNEGLPFARFLVEHRVTVGTIDGWPISGSLDLYDIERREVTDWKIVGVNTLKLVKANGVGPTYNVQRHLYGRGLTFDGWPVDRVRIALLPRNEPTLANAKTYVADYDEQVAIDALDRATEFARDLSLVLSNESADLDTYLAHLPALEGDCWSCARYPRPDGTLPLPPGHWERTPFAGII